MATVIKIKTSSTNAKPESGGTPTVATGELAYSYFSPSAQNNLGGRLYIGTGTESSGMAASLQIVGGEYFTTMLDHVHGTATASSAAILDSNSKIDVWNVDNLRLDGNTISSQDTNGNITLSPNGTGDIVLDANGADITTTGTLGHTGGVNVTGATALTGSLTVSTTLGVTGIATLSSNATVGGTLGVTGESTLASAIVSDLTAARVTFAGASGALVDDANFTFNASTDTLNVTGKATVDNLQLDGNTLSVTDTNGALTLTPNGTGRTVISSTSALTLPVGNTSNRGTPSAGDVRYNSQLAQFEGYGTAWGSLGGVKDVDADTFITAESSAGADEDTLTFTTGGVLQGTMNDTTGFKYDNLQILGNNINSTDSNGNIVLDPNGSGIVSLAANVTVTGNLTVQGTTTTVASTTVTIADPIFTLGGSSAPGSNDSKDRGIEFNYHNGSAAKVGFFGYDESADVFTFIEDATNTSEVFTGTAGAVKFGASEVNTLKFTTHTATTLVATDASGNATFLAKTAGDYGLEGQVAQLNGSGVPFFGHIDGGTY